MLAEETRKKLSDLRLHGVLRGLDEQRNNEEFQQLNFEDRFGLLIDREWEERESRKLTRLLQKAKFKYPKACLEDLSYQPSRGLNRSVVQQLASGRWIREAQKVVITGATGCGKTYVACALGNKACRLGYSVMYFRVQRLLQELLVARADGSVERVLTRIAKADLLILDDWGLVPFNGDNRSDMLDIIEEREAIKATMIASQIPVAQWHDSIGEPLMADAILDRLVHTAHRIELKGESMRKNTSTTNPGD